MAAEKWRGDGSMKIGGFRQNPRGRGHRKIELPCLPALRILHSDRMVRFCVAETIAVLDKVPPSLAGSFPHGRPPPNHADAPRAWILDSTNTPMSGLAACIPVRRSARNAPVGAGRKPRTRYNPAPRLVRGFRRTLADMDWGGMAARPVLLVCSVAAAAFFCGPMPANVTIIGPP